MKKLLNIIFVTFFHLSVSGQEKLIKDFDGDKINDTAYMDRLSSKIVCRLSTQHFLKSNSKEIGILNEHSGISLTKNGFEFFNNWMRAGYKNQFRYSPKEKKIQLIGMSRYEFGDLLKDGSGESSVNLLTNDYIGDWNFYDEIKDELIPVAIKAKLVIPKTFLESFSEETYFNYGKRCSDLFEKHKSLLLKKE